jgi:hypothetical protein
VAVRRARPESRAPSVPMTVLKRLPRRQRSLYVYVVHIIVAPFFYFPYFGGRKFPEPNTSHVPVVMTIIIISKANNTVHIISRLVFRWRVLYNIILIYYNTIMSRRKALHTHTHTHCIIHFFHRQTPSPALSKFLHDTCVCVVCICAEKNK